MVFQYKKIYDLVCSTLSTINADFVEHGKRVAYLMLRYTENDGASEQTLYRRVFSALFHDIGAYKIEKGERENLLRFDAERTYPHALEGYLFLKFFSPLKNNAEPVLYHHALWSERAGYNAEPFREGNLIHLLDRYDVLKLSGRPMRNIRELLLKSAGTQFEPASVVRFLNLAESENLASDLDDLSYRDKLDDYFATVEILSEDFEQYLRMMSFTFEVHSYTTLFHSNMTAVIAYELSRHCGLDQAARNKIFIAGLIHDLGKIKTPLSILEKPASLTHFEMIEMKKHVIYTKDLIAAYFDPETVRNAARHHEKLNGTGYPDGLISSEISQTERILCVADIISALYTKRSYKESFDTALVIEILKGMVSCGEIDPAVVAVFTDHLTEIMAVVNSENEKIVMRYNGAGVEYERLGKISLGY